MSALKRLILVAVLIVVGLLWLSGGFQGGLNQDSLSIAQIKDSLTIARDKVLRTFESESEEDQNQPVSAFKWQDEQGNWHFGDQPPESLTSEAIVIQPIQTIDAVEPQLSETAAKAETVLPSGPTEYIDRSRQLMEDAKQVEDMLQQRDEERRKALESL